MKLYKFIIAFYISKITKNKNYYNEITFIKKQSIQNALIESVDLLKDKDFTRIKSRIDSAMLVGEDKSPGLSSEDIDSRYGGEAERDPQPTGWNVIDEALDGGLSYGELGVVLAPSSAGKSWALIHIATNLIKRGKILPGEYHD